MSNVEKVATATPARPSNSVVEGGRTTLPSPRTNSPVPEVESDKIHERGQKVIENAHLSAAYRSSTLRLYKHRLSAVQDLPGFESFRERARALKREVITHLDYYVDQFATSVERQGGHVHWALDARDACSIIVEIARRAGAGLVIK